MLEHRNQERFTLCNSCVVLTSTPYPPPMCPTPRGIEDCAHCGSFEITQLWRNATKEFEKVFYTQSVNIL